MRPCWSAAALLLGVSTGAWAQGSAAVSGTVLGSNDLPLADVDVELIALSTGKITLDRTDVAGRFAFVGLRSGRYGLSFSAEGYAGRRLPARELLSGSPIDFVVKLDVLGPPLTRPRSGIENIAIEYGLAREQVAAVPILLGSQGRTSIDKLLPLAPGVVPTDGLELDPISGLGSGVSANGSRQSAINYRIDGSSNNAQNRLSGAQAATFAPPPEAVETFRVVTHTYAARDGRNAGAVVAPTTRSGGDSLHGGLRAIRRPFQSPIRSFDGSESALGGWAVGGQLGGPIPRTRRSFFFVDVEGWRTTQRHLEVAPVLSAAERAGDLSGLPQPVIDPRTNAPFPDNRIPSERLDPLMQRFLDAFVPLPNLGATANLSRSDLDSDGGVLLARLDHRREHWSFSARHLTQRIDALGPADDLLSAAPGVTRQERQLAHNARFAIDYAPSAKFSQTTALAAQRLSTSRRDGRRDFEGVSADAFGFDFRSFGVEVGTLPDVTLFDPSGAERLRIAPFLSAESSAQTTHEATHDLRWRGRGFTLRAGGMFRRGFWPFRDTENFAGSFSFPAPPAPPTRALPNGLRDLLLGRPGEFRLQTPRDLNLRWTERAAYGEVELRPLRSLSVTLGLRLESQPPATDTQDRIAAFRLGARSERFPETLPGLIFPGDSDGDRGPLPRSTIDTAGRNLAPRIGVAYSPTSDRGPLRLLLGESGRSVFRFSFGEFYDFGAFAGSSAAALFQSTFPPFSVDNRFDFSRATPGEAFRRPLGQISVADPFQLVSDVARFPVLVFDRDFENARARHFNAGFQRLLPAGVLLSAVYVGTRSDNLQRQRELNTFVRNPLLGFAFVRSMRLSSRLTDVRQFESSGEASYDSLQLRANRFLRRGFAFDVGYTLSRSEDDGSGNFGNSLVTEPRTVSDFDRRHNLTATWLYEARLPRSWPARLRFLDGWSISGTWRARSGLPLDVVQTEDPTFTFEQVGRPDLVGEFRLLDPDQVRTFTLADGREITGRFAFDPTAFQRVEPTDFDQTRNGTVQRNAFRLPGFQRVDLRLARSFEASEGVTLRFGLDLLNIFGASNWRVPFTNVDHPFFGVARSEGLRRSAQFNLRVEF